MFQKYVKLGLVLLVTGSAVLGWVLSEKSKDRKKAAYYRSKYGSEPDEYLKQYNEWLELPPEQRANLPWWLDKYGKTKTEAQLQQEQQDRLNADLEKLATGKKDADPFADILYGENWKKKLNEYKKRRQLREYIFTGSILSALTGGAICTYCLVLLIYRTLTKASSHLRKTVAAVSGSQRPNKGKQPAQADAIAKAKIKPEAKAKGMFWAEPEARIKVTAEEKAKAEARAKLEARAKAEAMAKAEARAKAETRAKAEAERKAKAEAEKLAIAKEKARQKAEAEERARAEAEAREKAKAERKAKAQAEKLAKAEEKARKKAEAEEKARANAEAKEKAKAERKAKAQAEKLAGAEVKAGKKAEAEEKAGVECDIAEKAAGQKEKQQEEQGRPEKNSQVGENSERQNLGANYTKQDKQPVPQTPFSAKSGTGDKNSAKNPKETAVLPLDEKSIELVEALEAAAENLNVSRKPEDSIKAQTENLEKQMAEFKQMARGVQQTTLEHSKPINNTLSELTQQVSAIREYAASQQDRLTKLQDGYDWNITRTFCLRVIRCIDNLERRISQMTEKNIDAADLEEVRDEMLFALESSGVEQFEPEINSDYHGQEKYAEAIKEKESCDGTNNRTGKIAKIIRPGYQYFIDEENVKVVRPAQVKLFG